MKTTRTMKRFLTPAMMLGLCSVSAQSPEPTQLVPVPTDARHRLSASFRAAFNLSTQFENFGAFVPAGAARLTPDGDSFNYDDGYVLTDSSGNLLGYTRYWGYDYDSGPNNQLPGDGTIVMHQYSSTGATTEGDLDELQPGFELKYSYELGRREKLRWGLEAAFGYMNVAVNDSQPIGLNVARLSHAYALPAVEGGGYVTPPPAPYYHGADLSPDGNPVIGATPVAITSDTMLASVSGSRDFKADIFSLRLGPYLEFPLGEKWTASVSAGLALAQVYSDFSFSESVSIPNVPTLTGDGTHNDLQIGGYAAANIAYRLNHAWEVSGGVEFQNVGEYSHWENNRAAVLNMERTIYVTVGASYSF